MQRKGRFTEAFQIIPYALDEIPMRLIQLVQHGIKLRLLPAFPGKQPFLVHGITRVAGRLDEANEALSSLIKGIAGSIAARGMAGPLTAAQ